MARLRSLGEVVERCGRLRADLSSAVSGSDPAAPATVEGLWQAEPLGTLLWALQLAELPPYDRPFSPDEALAGEAPRGRLRRADEIELERRSARLWHWRARTTDLQAAGAVELPERYASFDQLIAATVMRGYEEGLLPQPLRGDFRAFGKIYRHLSPAQHAEALSIAFERHRALNWLCGLGSSWDDVPLDT